MPRSIRQVQEALGSPPAQRDDLLGVARPPSPPSPGRHVDPVIAKLIAYRSTPSAFMGRWSVCVRACVRKRVHDAMCCLLAWVIAKYCLPPAPLVSGVGRRQRCGGVGGKGEAVWVWVCVCRVC